MMHVYSTSALGTARLCPVRGKVYVVRLGHAMLVSNQRPTNHKASCSQPSDPWTRCSSNTLKLPSNRHVCDLECVEGLRLVEQTL